jgi:hypothetical protein
MFNSIKVYILYVEKPILPPKLDNLKIIYIRKIIRLSVENYQTSQKN